MDISLLFNIDEKYPFNKLLFAVVIVICEYIFKILSSDLINYLSLFFQSKIDFFFKLQLVKINFNFSGDN